MFEAVTAFFISIIVAFFGLFTCFIPEEKPLEAIEASADIFAEYPIADTVYVLESGTFTDIRERHTAVGLQGVAAKTSPSIYIKTNSVDETYLSELEKAGHTLSFSDENGERWTLASLMKKFAHLVTDSGYVLYSYDENSEGLNVATNYAAAYGWLPVPEELEDIAIQAGLTKIKDISEDEYTVKYQRKLFNKIKKDIKKDAVIHQAPDATGLRDFAIQQGFFTFFTRDEIKNELRFRNKVLSYLGDNAQILGWTRDEITFVRSISEKGNPVSPADHAHNNSILASFGCEYTLPKAEKDTYTDETKHYAALVMSDGDNMQWIQNGYSEYFAKLALEEQFPVTWSFPPLLQYFSSVTVKTVFEAAGKEDYFMAGVSGAGYMNPSRYPKKALTGFTDRTAAAMAESGLEYVQLLDSTPENAIDEVKLTNTLAYFARYRNIKGGIVSLDPSRYEGGQGKMYIVNGKPFMTYRLSLWHPSNNMSEVTKEWLDEQADKVNAYPADIHSENGYSVINIHPWTISTESLAYFVSQLDSHIELVTVEELMEKINHNLSE